MGARRGEVALGERGGGVAGAGTGLLLLLLLHKTRCCELEALLHIIIFPKANYMQDWEFHEGAIIGKIATTKLDLHFPPCHFLPFMQTEPASTSKPPCCFHLKRPFFIFLFDTLGDFELPD